MNSNLAETDVLLLRREVALEKRRKQLREENAIFFYQPHPKQYLFHAAASYHYRYARTGNRFGKSEMGAAEDVAFAMGFRPWVDENDPLRTLGIPKHPTKGLIVCIDWDKSAEAFTSLETGKLWKYIPKDKLIGTPEKNHSGSIDLIRVRHVSGGVSTIHLDTVKSYKQNPLGQETSYWDWIHYDEPPAEGMYKANIRGLIDNDGRVWFTCTPLEEPWIDQLFQPDIQEQVKSDTAPTALGDFWMMTGATDDNPHNTQEAINRVMSQYSEEERETRRSGVPRAYSGLVYKEFQWEIHVRREPPVGWKSWQEPPLDHTLRFAIDYHPRKPHHVMFIATSPQEYHYVYAELFISCLMSELVAEIRLALHLREPTVPGLIDPLSDTPNRVTDITPLEEVLRLGLPVMAATKDPYNGILAVKELLKTRDRAHNPIIQFNSLCRRTIFEIARGYVWDSDTNKPKKENDDAMENFYRLALQGLSYIEPAGVNDYTTVRPRNFATPIIIHPDEFALAGSSADRDKRERFAKRYRR